MVHAHIGDRRHPTDVLEKRDRVTAERDRGAVLIARGLGVIAAVGVDIAGLDAEVAHEGDDRRHSDRELDLDGGDVERVAKALLERQDAVRLTVVVVEVRGRVRVLVDQWRRPVIYRRVDRGGSGADDGRVRVRLHRRAHVHDLGRPVVLPAGGVVVGRADHGQDLPVLRVLSHQRRRQLSARVSPGVCSQVVDHDALAELLHAEVKGGLHVQLLDSWSKPELPKLSLDVVDEVGRQEAVGRGLINKLLRQRLVHVGRGDVAGPDHGLQNLCLPELRGVRVQHRVPLGGRLG